MQFSFYQDRKIYLSLYRQSYIVNESSVCNQKVKKSNETRKTFIKNNVICWNKSRKNLISPMKFYERF